jgi:hypothetical protein
MGIISRDARPGSTGIVKVDGASGSACAGWSEPAVAQGEPMKHFTY